jgi:hypothetical protein
MTFVNLRLGEEKEEMDEGRLKASLYLLVGCGPSAPHRTGQPDTFSKPARQPVSGDLSNHSSTTSRTLYEKDQLYGLEVCKCQDAWPVKHNGDQHTIAYDEKSPPNRLSPPAFSTPGAGSPHHVPETSKGEMRQ